MLGDVLLIEDKHKQAAAAIREKIMADHKPKRIVAISGESGSGKSELAHCLARALKDAGVRAKVMPSDNFYRVPPRDRNAWRQTHGAESIGLDEYDWEKIRSTFDDFKNSKKAEMPCIDLVTDQVDTLTTDFSEIDLLVFDGLYAINADGVDMRVYIDLTYHETKKAQLLRGKEKVNEWRMTVLEREHQVIRSLRDKADFIINKSYQLEAA
jgi:uridine kinase